MDGNGVTWLNATATRGSKARNFEFFVKMSIPKDSTAVPTQILLNGPMEFYAKNGLFSYSSLC